MVPVNYPGCYVGEADVAEVGLLLPVFRTQLSYLRFQTLPAPYDDDMEMNNTVGQAAEAQTTFLDAADELDQPQCLVSFGAAVAGAPDPSLTDSAQQLLESAGDVEPTSLSRTAKRNRKRRQKRRDLGASWREDVRRERHAEAVKNAIIVPVELVNLRPSPKPRHETRVYRHEELAQIGVKVIQWDGAYVLSPLPGFFQLT